MTTTFIDMRPSLIRLRQAAIIGVLMVLTGCSAIRLAYNNAPQFAWWWLDGYMDFSSEHSPRVKGALDQWFSWHKQTQLDDYAAWLVTLQRRIEQPTTAAEVCGWFDQVREKAQPAIDRALLIASELLPTLGVAQINHLEQRYAKNNAEFRDQYIKASAAERHEARRKRATESAERLYGKLGPAQLQVLEANLASTPFDPAASLAEREKRQRETLQTMRGWVAEQPDRAQLLAAMRQLWERQERPSDAAARAQQQRATEQSCRATAALHNSTTAAQRQAARAQLKSWEEDLRALSAEKAS